MDFANYAGHGDNIIIYEGKIIARFLSAILVDVQNLPVGALWRARSGVWYRIIQGFNCRLIEPVNEPPEEAKLLILLAGDSP